MEVFMYNNFLSKKSKKAISALLASVLVITAAPISADAATKKVVGVGKSTTVSVSASAKVTGLSKAEKKVVKVTKKGKKFTIKGKKAGKASFKIGKKSFNVKVGATSIKKKSFATSLTVGTNKTVKVTAANGKADTLTWKSNKTAVVKVAKASSKANSSKVASNTLQPKKAGSATITITSKNTGKKLSVKVTVKAKATPTNSPAATTEVPVTTAPAATTEVPVTTAPAATTPAATTEVPVTTTPAATTEVPVTTAPAATTPVATTEVPQTSETPSGPAVSEVPQTSETPSGPAVSEAPQTSEAPVVATNGTITVVVKDVSGAAVSGAAVEVISGTAVVANVTAAATDNSVSIEKIENGTYVVRVIKAGYKEITAESVVVNGNDVTVEVTLAKDSEK